MSLYNDPQWIKDSQIYQNDILKFALDAFDFQSTWQQKLLFDNADVLGSRTSVKYGWGCNESMIDAYAIIALHNLLFRKDSVSIIMTSKNNNSNAVIHNVIKQFIKCLDKNKLSYLSKYITNNQNSFSIKKYEYFTYIKIIKDVASVGPISIAGILNYNYLFIAFDAEKIKYEWLSVGLSNMAQPENRCIFSQRMDTDILKAGQFYQFTKHESWKEFKFSSAEDPNHVWSEHDQFAMKNGLKSCVIDGEYYRKSSFYKYSINLENALKALKNKNQFNPKEYVLSIQAIDLQRSVIGLFGLGSQGKVELIDIPYFKEFDLNRMFKIIKALIGKYPKIRVILNCLGTGIILKKLLEKHGIQFETMNLSGPCFYLNERVKFRNIRAKAFKKLQDCILEGKLSIKTAKKNKLIIKELINIPHYIDCDKRYAIPTSDEISKFEMQDLIISRAIAACFIK